MKARRLLSLAQITTPSGVTAIDSSAFRFCGNLKTITIPVSVTQIVSGAFYDCDSMTDVYYGGTALQWAQVESGSLNEGLDIATIHFSEPLAGFTDVGSYDYYADAVQWAVSQGGTNGTGANTFSPANTVTRAEAVTFLWRAAGSPAPASSVSPFSDVTDPGAYYYNAVLWAAEQGITTGGAAWAQQNGLTDGLSLCRQGQLSSQRRGLLPVEAAGVAPRRAEGFR